MENIRRMEPLQGGQRYSFRFDRKKGAVVQDPKRLLLAAYDENQECMRAQLKVYTALAYDILGGTDGNDLPWGINFVHLTLEVCLTSTHIEHGLPLERNPRLCIVNQYNNPSVASGDAFLWICSQESAIINNVYLRRFKGTRAVVDQSLPPDPSRIVIKLLLKFEEHIRNVCSEMHYAASIRKELHRSKTAG